MPTAGCTRPTGRTGYDKSAGPFPDDVFAWLEETQPERVGEGRQAAMSPAEQAKAKDQLLDRLVKTLDTAAGRGWRHAERAPQGVQEDARASSQMCEFKPATTLNAAAMARYRRSGCG